MWYCWLTWRSLPWWSHLLLYGCGCGVVDNPNCLTTSIEMRLSSLSLTTMKCNGVPFTHIYEWNIFSPSSGYTSCSSWIVVVVTLAVEYASMICLVSIFYGLDSESGLGSVSLTSTTNDCFKRHSLVLCQGIFWKSHHFPVSFFVFPLPFFSFVLDWLSGGCWLGLSLPCFDYWGFADPNFHLFWCLNFCLILTTYR